MTAAAAVEVSGKFVDKDLPSYEVYSIGPFTLWDGTYTFNSDGMIQCSLSFVNINLLDNQRRRLLSIEDNSMEDMKSAHVLSSDSAMTCDSQCVIASGLETCSFMNGMPVCASTDLQTLDAQVKSFVRGMMSKGGVGCAYDILAYACSVYIPQCSGANTNTLVPVCHSDCTSSLTLCGLSASDRSLVCDGHATSPLDPTVSATQSCQPLHVTPAPATCVVASGLQTCSAANGHHVQLLSLLFDSLADADAYVQQKLNSQVCGHTIVRP